MRKSIVILMLLIASMSLFAQGTAEANNAYPTNKVQFIIPYNAGGGTDTLMRLLATAMEADLGQSFIITNKAGGLGQVGLTELSAAKPDGYTIGALSNLDHILVLKTSSNVAYTYDSFEYLGAINTTANVLYVNDSATGFKTIEDVIAYAKANPGKLTVAVSGKTHIAELALLEKETGIDVTTVMQSSGNDSLKAVLGGHVDMALMDKNFVSQVAGMGVTPIVSFASEHIPVINDIPTLKDYGYNIATETYRVIVAPKGTPEYICKILTDCIKRVSSTEEFQSKMAGMKETYRFLDAVQVKERLDGDYKLVEELLKAVPDAFN